MPGSLRLVLGDQLSHSIASLRGIDAEHDTVLICEVMAEATYVKHHQKKIAFLFAAMRHFAAELSAQGIRVRHVKLDDPANTGTIDGEVKRALADIPLRQLIATEPGEFRLKATMLAWQNLAGIACEIREDDRFLAAHADFANWADGKKQLRMEYFYREMRRRYGILMDKDGLPEGGAFNFDHENRKPPPKGLTSPPRISHKKSTITREVLTLVKEKFSHHFGTLEPFHFAVTRNEALIELRNFIAELLPQFGTYQDVMVANEAYLYHSLLSSYLNAGLLLPLEICQAAEAAYREGLVPIASAEGFIRQILGWREYVRGIYWYKMPDYARMNFLNANRALPEFYWSGETEMFCLAEAVRHTREHAYSHHIQRLMITGNFALLAGIDVAAVCEWYLLVYSDAYEWVELPNTLGMALFADGGLMASKPYAASGKYIARMSNFCRHCRYNPKETTADDACPFNALYWDFLARNEHLLRTNQRLFYTYATWDKMSQESRVAIRAKAAEFLAGETFVP